MIQETNNQRSGQMTWSKISPNRHQSGETTINGTSQTPTTVLSDSFIMAICITITDYRHGQQSMYSSPGGGEDEF